MPHPRRCRPSLSVAGRAGPARPAERLGADAVALEQSVARPRQARMLVAVGEVAPAQLDRVEVRARTPARPAPIPARSCPGLRPAPAPGWAAARSPAPGGAWWRRWGRRTSCAWASRPDRRTRHRSRSAPRCRAGGQRCVSVARGADAQLLHRLLPPADQGEHLSARKSSSRTGRPSCLAARQASTRQGTQAPPFEPKPPPR